MADNHPPVHPVAAKIVSHAVEDKVAAVAAKAPVGATGTTGNAAVQFKSRMDGLKDLRSRLQAQLAEVEKQIAAVGTTGSTGSTGTAPAAA